jgi:hypothetical protein
MTRRRPQITTFVHTGDTVTVSYTKDGDKNHAKT